MNIDEKFEDWRWRSAAMAAVGAALMVAVGCAPGEEPDGPGASTAEHTLSPATSCEEVEDHIANALTEEAIDRLYGNHYPVVADDAPAEEDGSANDDSGGADSGESGDGPDDHTDTNIQEEGVDEPDIVKTGDGSHVYTVVNDSLQVLDSWPPEETDLVGEAQFDEDVRPDSMFLDGDRAVVLSRQNERRYGTPEPVQNQDDGDDADEDDDELAFSGTRVSTFDVSEPESPQLVRELAIEGSKVDARMIDGEIFLVTNSTMRGVSFRDLVDHDDEIIEQLPERDWDEDEEELEQMRQEARPLLEDYFEDEVDELEVDEWMPRQRVGASGDVETMYECTELYLPGVTAELGVLNVTSIDVEDDATLDSTGLIADGWEVYASQTNLYVAMSSRSWWWGPWGAGDQDNESHIHKFQLLGDDDPKYMASGVVDGWILDQFSFSEHENHLRVATTDNRWEWEDGEATDEGGNHMIVLKRQGDELVETGSVRDLAPTERIYSVRFMGDRGFMVTFRFVDPFYTFDLSDPNDPEMLGELKIQGFSNYMHPIDENHLLAIGRDGEEDGTITGVHVQIFDVTDMEDPQRTHHHTISTGSWSSWSEANHDHHAFTYQDEEGILAMPISIREDGEYFNGLIVLEATVDGIEEVGRIAHDELIAKSWCEDNGQTYGEDCDYDAGDTWYHWRNRMRRSIMMTGETGEEYLYSLSDVGMRVNDVFDLDEEYASVLLD